MEGNQEPPPPQPPQQSSPQSSTGNPPPAPDAAHVQYHHLVQQQQQQLQMFWYYKRQEIENAKDFKNHQFPLARIKKIMKADQDVRMVSADAPIVLAKACELFIQELTIRSWLHPEANNRLTLQKNDITATIARTDIFDFLVDIIPRDEEIKDEAAGLGMMPPSTGIVGPPSDGVGPTASAPNSGDDGSNGSAPHTAKNVNNAVRTPWNTEEDEKEIRMWFDMPGLAADNIEVDIVDDLLVIKGDGGIDAFGNKIHSPYDSRLQLPFNAWKEEVTAVFKNGVLYLTVPKILKKQHKMIHIPVRNERQV